jgi:hypothetical protein
MYTLLPTREFLDHDSAAAVYTCGEMAKLKKKKKKREGDGMGRGTAEIGKLWDEVGKTKKGDEHEHKLHARCASFCLLKKRSEHTTTTTTNRSLCGDRIVPSSRRMKKSTAPSALQVPHALCGGAPKRCVTFSRSIQG